MNKPATILTTASLLFVALCMLAVTVKDHFSSKENFKKPLASKTVGAGPVFADAGLTHNPAHGKPGHRHDLPDGAPLPKNAAITTPANPASLTNIASSSLTEGIENKEAAPAGAVLNPPHGKPGHRCGVAVGAPLSSEITSAVTSDAAKTAPAATGLNPEHGKPGHRCDIAVGAPLKGAPPKTVAAQTVPPQTPVSLANALTPVPKLNPAHGKPHHRCDISVGAPLTSKPAATNSSPLQASSPSPIKNADSLSASSSKVIQDSIIR